MPGGPLVIDPDTPGKRVAIPTVLQIQDDVLRYWTGLTCLYDRYHKPDPEFPTLPICVYHVTKITPVYAVETSNKRVILHEPEAEKGEYGKKVLSDRLRENVIRTIVDNSVKQPTQYNVEAIVPFHPLGRHIRQGVKTVTDMIAGFDALVGNNALGAATIATAAMAGMAAAGAAGSVGGALGAAGAGFVGATMQGAGIDVFSLVNRYLNYLQTALKTADKLPWVDNITYINMNSLEAMASSCRLLCMKMWTGYDYKFVEITGLTFEKKGTEDDVYRASFTLKERPILATAKTTRTLDPPRQSWLVKTHRPLVRALETITGVTGESATNGKAVMTEAENMPIITAINR